MNCLEEIYENCGIKWQIMVWFNSFIVILILIV